MIVCLLNFKKLRVMIEMSRFFNASNSLMRCIVDVLSEVTIASECDMLPKLLHFIQQNCTFHCADKKAQVVSVQRADHHFEYIGWISLRKDFNVESGT